MSKLLRKLKANRTAIRNMIKRCGGNLQGYYNYYNGMWNKEITKAFYEGDLQSLKTVQLAIRREQRRLHKLAEPKVETPNKFWLASLYTYDTLRFITAEVYLKKRDALLFRRECNSAYVVVMGPYLLKEDASDN